MSAPRSGQVIFQNFYIFPQKLFGKKKKLTPLKKKKIPRNKTERKHEQHFPTCFPFPNVCHLVDFRAILGVKHRTEHLQQKTAVGMG